MRKKYKLLVTDVDGTLVNKEGKVSPENREALAEVVKAGVKVCLSTGRGIQSCMPYLDELGLDGHHIFYDGALVHCLSTGEHVYIHHLSAPLVKEMIEFSRGIGFNLELASVERYFSEKETWSTDIKRKFFNINTTISDVTGLEEREKIIRADLVITDPESEAKANRFVEHFKGRVQFSEAHSEAYDNVIFINVIAPGMSKGRALEALGAHLKIAMENVMAVGDWVNDISMLETAGLGVAMGNAREELKAVADYVTLDVGNNGLAAAVRKFIL